MSDITSTMPDRATGRPDDAARQPVSGAFAAAWRIGSRLQARLLRLGKLGEYSVIRPPYTIAGARHIFIGARTLIGRNAMLLALDRYAGETYEPAMRIGDDTRIGQNFLASCTGEFRIGSRVVISQNVHVGDTLHRYDDPDTPVIDQPMTRGYVIVADDAFVGVNAVILPNVRVGRHAVIGAGAVVTTDVPDFCVAAGNPARILRRYDPARRAWIRADRESAPTGRVGAGAMRGLRLVTRFGSDRDGEGDERAA
jgi:acetyltransferase-like isoleucine patch superfamily enzyme